jgi:hypothetical protein
MYPSTSTIVTLPLVPNPVRQSEPKSGWPTALQPCVQRGAFQCYRAAHASAAACVPTFAQTTGLYDETGFIIYGGAVRRPRA